MTSTDLYIVAAGNGSRINVNVPKALVLITDEPCLTTTLQQIAHKFRKVFVITNATVQDQWENYFAGLEASYPELARMTVNVPIRSGLGDGHATLEGLLAAEGMGGDSATDVVVAWGDVFFPQSEIIDELLGLEQDGPGIVPAVFKSRPYVSLWVDDGMRCISARFSKHGEDRQTGFHDQSVFRFKRSRLRRSLSDLHSVLWKGDRYISPGGEFSLLYVFHYLYNVGDPVSVYETAYPTLSFNTVEEVVTIQREIGASWRLQFRGA